VSIDQQAEAAKAQDEKEKEKIRLEQESKSKDKTGDLTTGSDVIPEGYDRSYAQNLYGEAQSNYLKYLSDFRDKSELKVKYLAVEPKGKTAEEKQRSLLFAEDVFKDVLLIPRNYTALQYDHVLTLKSKLDDYLRRQTIPIRELHDRGEKLPEGWDTLLRDKANTESEYYRDAVRIFYNMKLDDKVRAISDLEADMLDRTNRKVAVDVGFMKSETGPKKNET
jgi:hypothetical protein